MCIRDSADDARNGVRVVPLRSENDALARGRSAHRAPDIFLLFSRVARKLRWNEWLDAPDVTDRASEA